MFKLKFRHAVAGLDICVVSLGWWSVVRLIWLNRGRFVCDPSGVQTGLFLKTKLLLAGVRMDPKKWYMHCSSFHVTVYRNATGKGVFINTAYFPRSCYVLLDLQMCWVA